MSEMDESLHILLDFMRTLTEMKEIIEKEINIQQYCNDLFPYISHIRNNVSYTYELLSKYNDSNYKNEYVKTLDLLNETCNKLEMFCNYSLLQNMELSNELATKFDNFTYSLGSSLIQLSNVLKFSTEVFNK